MTALQLELGLVGLPPRVEGETIQDRFESFHDLNPWILTALIRLADDLVEQGASRIGVKMLVEVLRWSHARQTQGDAFKINNTYASRYARLIVSARPDLAPMIEQRVLTA